MHTLKAEDNLTMLNRMANIQAEEITAISDSISDYTDTFTQYYILLRGFTHIFYRQLCRFIKSGKMMKATRTPHKHWGFQ